MDNINQHRIILYYKLPQNITVDNEATSVHWLGIPLPQIPHIDLGKANFLSFGVVGLGYAGNPLPLTLIQVLQSWLAPF